MLLDDDERARRATSRLLRLGGHDVVAWDGRGGPLDSAATVDVAVVDYRLDGCTGVDWIRRLGADPGGAPSILYSGVDDPKVRAAALDAGAECCVSKPFVEELLSAIAGVARRRLARAAAEPPERHEAAAVAGWSDTVLVGGQIATLSAIPRRLLAILMRARGEVVSVDELQRAGVGTAVGTSLREHIRLRPGREFDNLLTIGRTGRA